jgi:hypothetical protein
MFDPPTCPHLKSGRFLIYVNCVTVILLICSLDFIFGVAFHMSYSEVKSVNQFIFQNQAYYTVSRTSFCVLFLKVPCFSDNPDKYALYCQYRRSMLSQFQNCLCQRFGKDFERICISLNIFSLCWLLTISLNVEHI